jgi:hypothetical protein
MMEACYHQRDSIYCMMTLRDIIMCSLTCQVLWQNDMCPACNKGREQDFTHVCEYSCSDCMSIPPCAGEERYPCDDCNRHFRSRKCFDKYKTNKMIGKEKTVCEGKRRCGTCGTLMQKRHECFKPFCKN